MKYIKKFVLGDYSLVKTFWIIFFIPSALIFIMQEINLYYYDSSNGPWIIVFLVFIYKISCFVAIWNSSDKYLGKKRWFYLVRLYLAIEVIFMSIKLIQILFLIFLYVVR